MFHEIKILNHKSKSKEIVKITFKRKDLEFKLSFGVGGNYRNHVTMYKNKKTILDLGLFSLVDLALESL